MDCGAEGDEQEVRISNVCTVCSAGSHAVVDPAWNEPFHASIRLTGGGNVGGAAHSLTIRGCRRRQRKRPSEPQWRTSRRPH